MEGIMTEYNNQMPQIGQTGYGTPIQEILGKMVKDMRFLGIMAIIMGAISCINLFGAIIGVPTIFIGIRLRESADNFKAYLYSGDNNQMNAALEKLSRYFYISKVLMIINIAIVGLMIIFLIALFSFIGFEALSTGDFV
jgi:hypothetical protein